MTNKMMLCRAGEGGILEVDLPLFLLFNIKGKKSRARGHCAKTRFGNMRSINGDEGARKFSPA